ncbi:MAG: UDP-N-acetylmuramate--L-alanine ligase [Clostridia bacterium]|nr:UDP-N-acetylmuramate--L-alanine ligase [Clostridia bacterium]
MKHIHIIGIGGISLSGLATILINKGYVVSGSDAHKSDLTQKLEKLGAKIFVGHSATNVDGAELVVRSAAIKDDNPEIVEAQRQGIKIIDRAELLGQIASEYQTVISVAGTHGKTTTTGMLASIFIAANKNPTVHIGGELPIIGGNVFIGGKKYFITEACEYYDSFLKLSSDYGVITNIQKDHLDYFKNLDNLQKSFEKFAKNTKYNGLCVTNLDDENCAKIKTKNMIKFSVLSNADYCATNITEQDQNYSFNVVEFGKNLGRISLSVPGIHNVSNAMAAIAVARQECIEFETIKNALETFCQSKRRYQQLTHQSGAVVVHDYAHHPTEIAATLAVARARTRGKLIVVFEPHTFSRTQYLWKEFCECFVGADQVIFAPIYPAREEPINGVTSKNLAVAVSESGQNAIAAESLDQAHDMLLPYLQKDNTILLLGAGTIVNLAQKFGID